VAWVGGFVECPEGGAAVAKTHKFAKSYVSITTALSATRVAEIASDLTSEMAQLRFCGADRGVVRFTLNDPTATRIEWIVFSVVLGAEGSRTTARTEILRYATNQSRVMFVPVASVEMLGYQEYLRFMDLLAGAIRIEDPLSTATISQGEGP
jgi:hypothetical protein